MVEFVTEPNNLSYFSDENSFQNIQSYQLGAKGVWQIPCTCIWLKGAAHYSWLVHGTYNEQFFVKADLDGNYFVDALGAIGIPFCICGCFNFVPYVGGSYDKANILIENSRSNFPGNPNHSGDRWYYSWYGPWVGFDFVFDGLCPSTMFTAGYEFHYGWAHQKNIPNHPGSFIFPYHVDYTNMVGNVFHIQCLFKTCSRWLYGLNLRYSVWSNNHKENAELDVPFSETGMSENMILKTSIFTWHSFSAAVNVGFCF